MNFKLDVINAVLIVVTLVNTIYGLIVYSRNRNDKTNLAFFVLTLTVSLWDISMFLYRGFYDHDTVLIWSRVLYFGASTIPLSFLYFVYIFPKATFTATKWQKYLLPVPFLFLTALSLGPFLVKDVVLVPNSESHIIFNEIFHGVYAVYIVGLFLWGYLVLAKQFFHSSGILRAQVLYIFIGTSVATSIGVFSNLIMLLFFNDFSFNWLGQVGTVVMIVAISYAVLKHHLFNVRVITTELFTFALWLFILIRTLSATDNTEKITNAILLLLTVVTGIFLIRSVKKEVEQRERIQNLASDLEKANKRLTELDRQKSEFVSFASHQLRAPLTAMKGYGSLLLEGDMGELPAAARDGIERIYDSTKTLVSIVDDYLNVSRIELGTMKYTFETIDLKMMVEDVIAELRPNIEKRGLKFAFKAEEGTADYRTTADRDKLKQVIANLIDNSVKYTPSGTVDVTLGYDKPKHALVFKVKDTGIGIDPEVLPKLFQKFSRAENGTRTNIKGTGLGLFVAKQIVEAHHGSIRAESPGEGKGSSFIVELEPFRKA